MLKEVTVMVGLGSPCFIVDKIDDAWLHGMQLLSATNFLGQIPLLLECLLNDLLASQSPQGGM